MSFFNDTVQLKICKVAEDRGVTAPYTFTAVATGDPSFPAGITKTVTVLPGQCQLVPGPYTNPNGTTGWRAGTKVMVSEGVVPGTAVTGITVSPTNRAVPGAENLTPLPDPANPAGSDAVILGSGETDISFMNSSEPDGTLKVCETAAWSRRARHSCSRSRRRHGCKHDDRARSGGIVQHCPEPGYVRRWLAVQLDRHDHADDSGGATHYATHRGQPGGQGAFGFRFDGDGCDR